jgi:carbonic anhydrase/acetyltransferase-like protein (isoleucine patch superfamily)
MSHPNLLILPYGTTRPTFAAPPRHAGPGAVVIGRSTLGRNAWLGALSVLRGDGNFIRAGDDFHLGARSTLHIAHDTFSCTVGDRVTVGENACVHACTVGNDVVVGDNVVILDGAVVEDNVVFEADATVFPGKRVPGGHLYAGSPAKPVRPLEPGEAAVRRQQLVVHNERRQADRLAASTPSAGSQVHDSVFIASTARVRGRLVAAQSSSIFFSNDFDAGDATITIGPRTNIQDNTVIRCATAQGVTLGRDATVGHNVTIHDCVIGNETLIGIGSTVAPGTIVEDRVLLAASARTAPGQRLESGWLYAGTPARKLAPLDAGKIAMTGIIVEHYCRYAQDFKAIEREAGKDTRAAHAGT